MTLNKYQHSTVDPFLNPPKLSYEGEQPGTAIINKAGKALREATVSNPDKQKFAPVVTPMSEYEQGLVYNTGVISDDDTD